MDIIAFSYKLTQNVSWKGPLIIISWYVVSGILIKIISPSIGHLVAVAQKLEGKYRSLHSNVSTNSEPIAC